MTTQKRPFLLALPRRLSSHLGFLILMLLFAGSITASTAYSIHRMRVDGIARQNEIITLQVREAEEHLTQHLNLISQTLSNLLRNENGITPHSTGKDLQSVLRNTPALRSLSLLDDSQQIVASSNPANVGVRLGHHDYMPPLSHSCDTARIGRPWIGRDFADATPTSSARPGDPRALSLVPVLLCAHRDRQTLQLVAALNPDYFINHYSSRLLAAEGAVDVLRYDGIVLMSSDERIAPGTQHAEAPFFTRAGAAEQGNFENLRHGDTPVISAYRASRLFPLVVVEHVSRDYALSGARAETRRLLQIVLPALLAVVLLATWLYLHLRRLEQQRAQARERERERLAATVFTHSREAIIIADAAGQIIDVNEAFTHITGYARDAVLGQNPRLLKSGRQDQGFYAVMWQSLTTKGYWHGELWNRHHAGHEFAALLTISAVRDTTGKTHNYVALFSDITAMKEQQRQLEHVAHYDSLTHLPNRSLFADRLQQGMLQSLRREQTLALVFIDLDGFKAVNDQHGHDAGDTLLATLAQRMRGALRDGDTLARIGGDEFVAILVDLRYPDDCHPVLQRLLQAASSPVQAAGATLQVSASAGVAFYPQHALDAELLTQLADQAMYLAKQDGRNCYRIHAGKPEDSGFDQLPRVIRDILGAARRQP